MTRWVAGLDGCPGGWVMVLMDLDERGPPRRRVLSQFVDALNAEEQPAFIGVDMPIGFPERAVHGGRACERMARQKLGPRRSSVFAAPSRAALAHNDYRDALEANRADGGPGISKQSFFLFPKMREVDAVMTPALQDRVVEIHPELAFTAIADEPMASPKRTREGRLQRLDALETAGFDRTALDPHPLKRREAQPDDLLDACAVACSAKRLAEGRAVRLPAAPPLDPRGLRMEIVY